jgi:hypothetical protein
MTRSIADDAPRLQYTVQLRNKQATKLPTAAERETAPHRAYRSARISSSRRRNSPESQPFQIAAVDGQINVARHPRG